MLGSTDPVDVVRRIPGWEGRARIVGTLDGGITNRNLLVEIDDQRYVLRLAGKNTELLDIDRRVERMAHARAASLGFAPEVVAFVEPEGFLVTRFVAGDPIAAAEFNDVDVLASVAEILRTFHESGPLPKEFDAFGVPARHRAAAEQCGVAIPDVYDAVDRVVREIAATFAETPDLPRACHNDLLAANFLRSRERLWLLDWEYAGMNDRFFDLGNLAVNNDLSPEAEEALVHAYFGVITRRRLARLRLMRIVSDAREAMWAVVQMGISTLDFDYPTYAQEHFDRLLRSAHASGYRDLLARAAVPEDA
jgi:thiamine kinase-like enzyme